jgi:hypothetical protein
VSVDGAWRGTRRGADGTRQRWALAIGRSCFRHRWITLLGAPRRHHRIGARPSGPFTEVSNVPFGAGIRAAFCSKAHLPTSALSRARAARPGIRASYTAAIRGRSRPCGHCFPAAFDCPASASWAPQSRQGIPPPLRSAYRTACAYAPEVRTPGTVSAFRTRETRTGPGALSTPGTAVPAGHRRIRGRRLPPHSGRSLPPRNNHPSPGCLRNEASARVPW